MPLTNKEAVAEGGGSSGPHNRLVKKVGQAQKSNPHSNKYNAYMLYVHVPCPSLKAAAAVFGERSAAGC